MSEDKNNWNGWGCTQQEHYRRYKKKQEQVMIGYVIECIQTTIPEVNFGSTKVLLTSCVDLLKLFKEGVRTKPMSMHTITGDLVELGLNGDFDVIVQGCNCFCKMGAGIAKQIKAQLPLAFEADQETISGDKKKLGTFSFADITVNDETLKNPRTLTIVNAYTQYRYDGKMDVDYVALRSAFSKIAEKYPDKKIGYPKIGAGLAGGDWDIISKIIEEELDGIDHTYVEFIE